MFAPTGMSFEKPEFSRALMKQMRDLGLDGVAIDYVEADPVVLAFLNENCNLHKAVCRLTIAVTRIPTSRCPASLGQELG